MGRSRDPTPPLPAGQIAGLEPRRGLRGHLLELGVGEEPHTLPLVLGGTATLECGLASFIWEVG